MNIGRICLFATAACLANQVSALTVDTSTIKNKALFGLEFPDETSFYAQADTVVSISKQTYSAGPLEVTEISIELAGSSSQIRIYCATAPAMEKAADAAADKLPEQAKPYAQIPDAARDKLQKADKKISEIGNVSKVVKVYPSTTHSHTLEFVVPNTEELEELYKQLKEDFLAAPSPNYNTNAPVVNETKTIPAELRRLPFMLRVPVGLRGKIYKVEKSK